MITMRCMKCGLDFQAGDCGEDTEHANVCLSTVAERDRLKRQNAEFVIEIAGLRHDLAEGVALAKEWMAFAEQLRAGIVALIADVDEGQISSDQTLERLVAMSKLVPTRTT